MPTTIAESDLDAIRYDRSGDIYLSIRGQQKRRLKEGETFLVFMYYEPKDVRFATKYFKHNHKIECIKG